MAGTWFPGDPWTLPLADPGAALAQRADALRALAMEVEVVADDAVSAAASPHWVCANADDVRARLRTCRAAAGRAAEDLRTEAGSLDAQASRNRQAAAQDYARTSTSSRGAS